MWSWVLDFEDNRVAQIPLLKQYLCPLIKISHIILFLQIFKAQQLVTVLGEYSIPSGKQVI